MDTSSGMEKGARKESPHESNSRLIIKNLPKHITEDRLAEHFRKMKDTDDVIVTDARIMRTGNKSRQFGFIGFKSEKHA